MICQNCQQKTAIRHIHYVRNGIVRDIYLCNECANSHAFKSIYENDIFKIMSSFLNEGAVNFKPAVKCECCGSDFETIRKTGKVGCGNCYKVFYEELSPIISRVHGNTLHVGKKPADSTDSQSVAQSESQSEPKIETKEQKIVQLKNEMAKAVKAEDFEKAAELRDEIKALEE